MLRRLVTSLLIGLVVVLGAVPARAETERAQPGRGEGMTAIYLVRYRKPGTTNWLEGGTYSTGAAAGAASEKLYRDGYEVTILSRVTLTHLPPRPSTGKLPSGETISPEQCAEVYRWASSMSDIAFKFPADGCYARAHLMIRRMQERGLRPAKVWSFQNGEPLYVRTKNIPAGYVQWKYHVAPVLRVRMPSGKQRWFVIDPALFKAPATISQWQNAQKRPGSPYTPYVTVARLGEAPVDAKGHRLPGSGYWPGPDPREGLNAHAVKMMRLYKPYQGKEPPRVLVRQERQVPRELLPWRRQEWLAA